MTYQEMLDIVCIVRKIPSTPTTQKVPPMVSITETLSGLQDQILDLVKTVQDPTVDAVEKVVETAKALAK